MVLHILACVLNYWYMSTKLTCQLLHTAHASHICCCCHLYHHPNRLFNSVLHTHTRFLSGVLAVLGSRAQISLCRQRNQRHVRPQKTRLHQPRPSHPSVSQRNIVNTKTAATAAAHCNAPFFNLVHLDSACSRYAPQRHRPCQCGVDLVVVNNRHLCRPAPTRTTLARLPPTQE